MKLFARKTVRMFDCSNQRCLTLCISVEEMGTHPIFLDIYAVLDNIERVKKRKYGMCPPTIYLNAGDICLQVNTPSTFAQDDEVPG